jgi:hypothetical protein
LREVSHEEVAVAARIAGIQPGYLPWLGYFDQMLLVDAFLIADEMPFSSSGWTHRNRIKAPTGPRWLTLPARPSRGGPICTVRLDATVPWKRKHVAALRHLYAKAAPAPALIDALETVLPGDATRLVDASGATIRFLAERLGVATPILVSSELGLEARFRAQHGDAAGATERIAAYLEMLGATELVEGESGRAYFDVALFERRGLRVHFHHYEHPTYAQLHGPFVSHLSAIDLLLNEGEEGARRVLHSARSRIAA